MDKSIIDALTTRKAVRRIYKNCKKGSYLSGAVDDFTKLCIVRRDADKPYAADNLITVTTKEAHMLNKCKERSKVFEEANANDNS